MEEDINLIEKYLAGDAEAREAALRSWLMSRVFFITTSFLTCYYAIISV
jgi:hypothetical protein